MVCTLNLCSYGQYTRSRYTVADTQWPIHSGRYTAADTRWPIHGGRYTVADPVVNTRQSIQIHSCGYTMGHIWQSIQIHSSRYMVANIQRRIHSDEHTAVDMQWLIHSGRYRVADLNTEQQIHTVFSTVPSDGHPWPSVSVLPQDGRNVGRHPPSSGGYCISLD
jgi:hypothetical protein